MKNYDKLELGRTLSTLGKDGENNNHGDCFNYGSVSGCDNNCPVFVDGKCKEFLGEDKMPMTPDEVVKNLEEILKFTAPLELIEKQAIQFAISLCKKLTEENLFKVIDDINCNQMPIEERMYSANIKKLAHAIVTYLGGEI